MLFWQKNSIPSQLLVILPILIFFNNAYAFENAGVSFMNKNSQGIVRPKKYFFTRADQCPPSLMEQGQIRRTTRSHLLEAQPNSNDESLYSDSDRVRRRQLLFSMLAASGAAVLQQPEASVADDGNVKSTEAGIALDQAEILYNVLKPPMDDREYYAYTLKENGLRVLLCSDPSTNEAAAAMDVHVGACSDPDDVKGLAHFCEHMLFLGTKPYPDEGSFEKFLTANGGRSNAYTSSEDTVYFFDMETGDTNNNKLSEALDRFGSFFSSPLFTEGATGRELNAIESENAKNLQSDSFRIFQIMKSRVNSDHPYSKFFTGNKKTLLEDTQSKGMSLRQELVNFYNKYYSANTMTLAIVAPQSIEELKKMVESSFAAIPNKQIPEPATAWAGKIPPFSAGSESTSVIPSLQNIVEIVPVQDLRQVTLSWPILYKSEEDKLDSIYTKPASYIGHLLGHEGPGSLLSYLKRKRWANSLSAGGEAEETDFELLEATVGLTTQGLANVDKVVEAVFSYITMLRDREIPRYIFDEVLQLDELSWRFATKGNAGQFATTLSTGMQQYKDNPELYVAGPRRLALSGFDGTYLSSDDPRTAFASEKQFQETRDIVDNMVNKMSASNVLVTVLSNTFDGQTDKKEYWYGTNYRVRPIPTTTLDEWMKPASPKVLNIDFPAPNRFIPTEAGLAVKNPPLPKPNVKIRDFEAMMEPIPPPKIIRDDDRWTVHFKQDDKFGKPKAFAIFQLQTGEAYTSPKQSVLSNLYALCVSDRIREYAYDAELAGLTYDVKVLPRGIRLSFGGYNEKLAKYVNYVSKKASKDINTFLPKNQVEFDRYKDQIARIFSAFDVKQPYSHASYYSTLTLMPTRYEYTNQEQREIVDDLTLQDLRNYVGVLWSSGKGQALLQGNLEEREAQEFVDQLDKTLKFKVISESEIPPQLEPLPLPASSSLDKTGVPTRLVISEPNPQNGNSCSHVLLQSLGTDPKSHVLIELIGAIVSEPFYDELRTKQQLGYIVSSGIRGVGKTRTIAFVAQSSNYNSEKLTNEILKYLDGVEGNLERLPKVDFGTYVKGLIDRKTEPDKTLATEVTRNWAEIISGRLEFNRRQSEVGALLELEKDDLVAFWKDLYSGSESRVLITEVVPQVGVASSKTPPKSTGYAAGEVGLSSEGVILGIDDIMQFRKNRDINFV